MAVRPTLGRFLALGLEFQLASDVLRTAVAPNFRELGQLAAVAAIRTALNYFLSKEIAEERREVAREHDPRAAAAPPVTGTSAPYRLEPAVAGSPKRPVHDRARIPGAMTGGVLGPVALAVTGAALVAAGAVEQAGPAATAPPRLAAVTRCRAHAAVATVVEDRSRRRDAIPLSHVCTRL